VKGWAKQAAEKLSFESVILSVAGVPGDSRFCRCWGGVAKDLLFAHVASKADPSLAQNRRDLRMTRLRFFQQPAKPRPCKEFMKQT
jgi:hypothetical protein